MLNLLPELLHGFLVLWILLHPVLFDLTICSENFGLVYFSEDRVVYEAIHFEFLKTLSLDKIRHLINDHLWLGAFDRHARLDDIMPAVFLARLELSLLADSELSLSSVHAIHCLVATQ